MSLTGTGGVGKTRLALQVAENALPQHTDGVWWVALAPVFAPERIPPACFFHPRTASHFLAWWRQAAEWSQKGGFLALAPEVRLEYQEKLRRELEALGSAAFSQALAEGQSLSFNQALASLPEIKIAIPDAK